MFFGKYLNKKIVLPLPGFRDFAKRRELPLYQLLLFIAVLAIIGGVILFRGMAISAKPTVLSKASSPSIDHGQSDTLTWTSKNTTSCKATSPGQWTTSTSTHGLQVVKPNSTTSYAIRCTGAAGTTASSVTVKVDAPAPPPLYTTSGNQILEDGQPYLPSDITLFGLSGVAANWSSTVQTDEAKMNAAASFWHVNSIRMQVQPDLVNNDTPGYLSTIEQEVGYAESLGMNVIISAQYEYTTKQQSPQADTVTFWETMAGVYGNDDHVWFDMFNEPSLDTTDVGGTQADLWNLWRNGGTIPKGTYVGMQTLVDDIRATGATNLLLAQGVTGGKSLALLGSYELSGSGIVYVIHTYLKSGYDTPADWTTDWATIAQSVPVFDDEFGVHEGPDTCNVNAPTLVPELFNMLAANNIGLGGWTLGDGIMITGETAYTSPTSFNPSVPFTCPATAITGTDAQGPGSLMLQFWERYSSPIR
ncbi:MAG TPA: cellulase family glycosylhydrolase [Candidatus Saccharimonadales bacterium]|nr:cellulase family glycosylhydrolase [Candidatus Saccharimonadales bacterium]